MSIETRHLASVGDRIKFLRERRGISQPELARKAGISQPSMYNIESGKTKSPSAINLMQIAAILEVSPWWLLIGDSAPESAEIADVVEWTSIFFQLSPPQRRAITAAARAMSKEHQS